MKKENIKAISWAPGYGAKISAEDAHAELERIRARNRGELTSELVLEAARNKGNILHAQIFDCGTKAAAEEHYKANARKLIRSIHVTRLEMPKQPMRVYEAIREEPSAASRGRTTRVFSDVEESLQDPVHREYLLSRAMADASVWRRKYAALSELAQVFRALDKVAQKVG